MSKSIKICADCKYFKNNRLNVENYSKCTNSNLATTNLVSGKVDYEYADIARNKERYCGKEAKYFEQKNCGKEAKYFEQKIGLLIKIKNKLMSFWGKQ